MPRSLPQTLNVAILWLFIIASSIFINVAFIEEVADDVSVNPNARSCPTEHHTMSLIETCH